MPFLPAFVEEIGGKPVVCYIDGDQLRGWCRTEEAARAFVRESLTEEVQKETDFSISDYATAFFWISKEQHRMIDLWTHSFKEDSDDGPCIEFACFQNGKDVTDVEYQASGSTIIAGGCEELHRREAESHEAYLSGLRPQLPKGMSEAFPGGGL